MKYEIYEVDPEFDSSHFLYIVLIRGGKYGWENEKKYTAGLWSIHTVGFNQENAIKSIEEELEVFKSNNFYRTEKDFSIIKIKLPLNVERSKYIEFDRLETQNGKTL